MQYLRKEVSAMLDIPARRVQFYTEQGLLSGFLAETGQGNERRYSRRNVLEFAIVKTLSDTGLALANIKWFMNQVLNINGEEKVYNLDHYKNDSWIQLAVYVPQKQLLIYLYHSELDLQGIILKNPAAIIVNFQKIYRAIRWID